MIRWIPLFVALLLGGVSPDPAPAQEFRALARVDVAASAVRDARRGGVAIDLALTQAVPWRVMTRADPARVILDFREVSWDGVTPDGLLGSDRVTALRMGLFRPGWSRIVLQLDGPYAVDSAQMVTDPNEGTARIEVRLRPTDADSFAVQSEAAIASDIWALPAADPTPAPRPRQTGDRPLVVALDPGHGGVDPGAERAGYRESDLMLQFARELQEVLLRTGRYEVVLTRDADVFVPLQTRITLARMAQADVFLSLHADAIAEGQASGATIYTLSDQASDAASQYLAESHSRDDLLLGLDLSEQDDEIAAVLMDLARAEVAPRSAALADMLVSGIGRATGRLHKRPRLEAGFSVLKAPDIPSVLVEVGFMSDPRDLSNLIEVQWRRRVAQGIVAALDAWALEDAADALKLRQ